LTHPDASELTPLSKPLPEVQEESGDAFLEIGLDPRLAQAVGRLGFAEPTPIQTAAIPPLLAGRDVLGGARTGSGKTAAFGLPLLQKIAEGGSQRALVLTPTRELALQITEALRTFAKQLPVRICAIYGGAPLPPQVRALEAGASVIVGTPGRIIDHMERGSLHLETVEFVVLDEADEMLRMGFIEDVERIVKAVPKTAQAALFSATMPEAIRKIANSWMNNPVELRVESTALTTEHIEQSVVFTPVTHKIPALARLLRAEAGVTTLVFTRTRAACAETADALAREGIAVDALHGDLQQAARERVVSRLRSGRLAVVIATDVAARGLDVEHIELVVNLDLPGDAETYVHRIGRTGRAGRAGRAISLVRPGERRRVEQLRRVLRANFTERPVPSDADIQARQRVLAGARLAQEKTGELEGARAWVAQLVAQGWDPQELAAAALSRWGALQGMDFTVAPDARPPSWAQPRSNREEPRFERNFDRGQGRNFRDSSEYGGDRERGGDYGRNEGNGPRGEGRPSEGRSFDNRNTDNRAPEANNPNPRGSDARAAEGRNAEGRNAENRAPDVRSPESKVAETRAPEARTGDRGFGEKRRAPFEVEGGEDERSSRFEGDRSQRGPRPSGPGPDEAELFLPVGQDRGLRPSDIVGAFANELGIPGRLIGRVTIVAHKTFVAVPKDIAHNVGMARPRLWLRGDEVPVFLARPQPTEHRGPHRELRPARPGRPLHSKGRS
jgi:ATP-dependent RNA helicase DeaD